MSSCDITMGKLLLPISAFRSLIYSYRVPNCKYRLARPRLSPCNRTPIHTMAERAAGMGRCLGTAGYRVDNVDDRRRVFAL